MKIQRFLDDTKVYHKCVRRGYYTHGTNSEYLAMFDKCKAARTDEDFIAVCADIWEHTDTEEMQASGVEFADFVCGILTDCTRYHVE